MPPSTRNAEINTGELPGADAIAHRRYLCQTLILSLCYIADFIGARSPQGRLHFGVTPTAKLTGCESLPCSWALAGSPGTGGARAVPGDCRSQSAQLAAQHGCPGAVPAAQHDISLQIASTRCYLNPEIPLEYFEFFLSLLVPAAHSAHPAGTSACHYNFTSLQQLYIFSSFFLFPSFSHLSQSPHYHLLPQQSCL